MSELSDKIRLLRLAAEFNERHGINGGNCMLDIMITYNHFYRALTDRAHLNGILLNREDPSVPIPDPPDPGPGPTE